jgi:hypothetical protein
MRRILVGASLSAGLLLTLSQLLSAAQSAAMDWPQVIADLTKERTQALACVGLLKSSGDKAAIDGVTMTYGSA